MKTVTEEKQASCAHENAWITLYEKYQTTYKLKGGEISETDEDLEPDPLWGVEFTCPDCHLCGYYPDWTNAPEPLRTYCQRCANEQEGKRENHVSNESATQQGNKQHVAQPMGCRGGHVSQTTP